MTKPSCCRTVGSPASRHPDRAVQLLGHPTPRRSGLSKGVHLTWLRTTFALTPHGRPARRTAFAASAVLSEISDLSNSLTAASTPRIRFEMASPCGCTSRPCVTAMKRTPAFVS